MKTETSKEVVKTKNEMVNFDYSKYIDNSTKVESLTSQIIIPRLSVVQKTSSVFEQGKAKIGDLFDYGSQEVITKQGENFEFIPVYLRMVKPEEKLIENRWEKTGKVTPLTASNEKEKWNYEINGESYRARPELHVYMFSQSQLSKIDEAIPYLMTFKGMSMKNGGKTLYTAVLITQQKFPCFAKQYKLKTIFDSEGKDTWYYSYVEPKATSVEPKYFDALFNWNKNLAMLADSLQIVGEEDSDPASSNSEVKESNTQF